MSPQPSKLDHLAHYLSSHSGTDKALMLLQYAPLLVIPLLPTDAARGLPVRRRGAQGVRRGLENLSSAVGDGRVLFRLFGLIPILQWYRAGLVRRRAQAQSSASSASALDAPAVKAKGWLLGEETVENMQIWSMLAYYPLEHIYYLASKRVLGVSPSKLAKIGVWSCRFWAVYVLLSLLSLYRKRLSLLRDTRKAVVPKAELRQAAKTLSLLTLVDLAYLPLTVHWSLPNGAWTGPFPTGLFGTIAALAQLKLGWEGSRAPVAPASEQDTQVSVGLVSRLAGQVERRLIETGLSALMWWDQVGAADVVDSVEVAGEKVAERLVGAVEEVKEKLE